MISALSDGYIRAVRPNWRNHWIRALQVFICFCAGGWTLAASPVLSRVSPLHGPPGTRVLLRGEGFVPGPGLGVQLGNLSATVIASSATQVEFQVPATGTSGLVELTTDGQTLRYPARFVVTRQVGGRLTPAAGITVTNYDVAGYGMFDSPEVSQGAFTLEVPVNEVMVVWAVLDSAQPVFAAVVTPSMTEVILDAGSTARALVFSVPGVNTTDPTLAATRLSQMNSLPQTAQLTSLISAAMAQGRSYLENAEVGARWQEIAAAILATPPPPGGPQVLGPLRPKDLFLKDLNPNYSNSIPATPVSLVSSLVPEPNDALARARFGLNGESPVNNVDWYIELFQVDPNAYPGEFGEIQQLTHTDRPPRLSLRPIQTGISRTKLGSEKLDLPALAVGALWDLVAGTANETFDPSLFQLPSRPPGVYVSHAYSGNVWYGTRAFLTQSSQADLIEQLGGDARWQEALAANLVVASLDAVSVLLPANAIVDDPNAVHELIHTVFVDVSKAIAIHAASGQWNQETAYELFKATAQSLFKGLLNLGIEAIASSGQDEGFVSRWVSRLGKLGGTVARVGAQSLNVFAKASSLAQAGERSIGLLLPGSLALERSILVIGTPFSPRITSFRPEYGRGGEVLTIQGGGFGGDTNQLRVSLRTYSGTDDPQNYDRRVDLPVLNATSTSIGVFVPADIAASFPNGSAFVVVERGRSNNIASSAVLGPPFREFRILPPPSVTSVVPNPAFPGDVLELRGLGFDNETARECEVLIDGVSYGVASAADPDGTRLSFAVFQDFPAGSHTVAVRFRGTTSASVPFQVVLPPYVTPPADPEGWGITVNKADLSNVADGRISVLEAFLIINGQLGREIEQHLPCEVLSPFDPNYCGPVDRETDFVSGDEPGRLIGPVDTVFFQGDQTFLGPFPALTPGDNFIFGQTLAGVVHPFTIDGSGAGGGTSGLVLDGITGAHVSGHLVVQNFPGHGIHLRNGSTGNLLEGVSVRNCGGDGIRIDNVPGNEFLNASASNNVGAGIHLTGPGAQRNQISSTKGAMLPYPPYDVISQCESGIRVDGGASFNRIIPGTIRNCQTAGIVVKDATNNFFGRETEELRRHFDLVNNNGPGASIGPNAVGNVFRYLNPIGNQGDGVLLEGPNCVSNTVDRTYAGINLYEGGGTLTISNQGSGIRLTAGASHNLIGTRLTTFGEKGSISGNRDDGVLLEGTNTAFNTVNAQFIGILDPYIGVAGLKFSGNGRSGIALRNGTHHNIIGDANTELVNAIFDCPGAGIELEGVGTDENIIFGNQIGAFLKRFVLSEGDPNHSRNGIWIHEGPRRNRIGLPGAAVVLPRYAGDTLGAPHQWWNAINTGTNAGVLIENAGGTAQPDGTIPDANVIQANHIGELDAGTLAPSNPGAGIKLGPGAWANVIGGPEPELGNRIRGWYRAGIWFDQNDLPSPELRNRIENNYIEGPGLGIAFRFTDYLVNTPSGGVGVLMTGSSGHPVGESLLTTNVLVLNRFGFYLADSIGNSLSGFVITNSYNAGGVIRGGGGNRIGGDSLDKGNIIQVSGFPNEPAWAGLALSHTVDNQVRGNLIGHRSSFRGAMGILLTNASNNEIGGPYKILGNEVISNHSHGIVISGPGSTGNSLRRNFVGRDRDDVARANLGDGVLLNTGAHDNVIGGEARVVIDTPSGALTRTNRCLNVIADNLGAGVRVDGGGTVGNRILGNQITANGGKGIHLENGGNHLQPPPVFVDYDGSSVFGNVASLAVTPPGSIIQLFTDSDPVEPEGDAFFGQATVQSNGTWRAVRGGSWLLPTLSMTATHATNGSTSEFGTAVPVENEVDFEIARTDAASTGTARPGATDLPVLRLSLRTINAGVRVNSIALDATGSLPDPTAVTGARLHVDTDEDGVVTPADVLLAGPVTFGADDGRITFAGLNAVIEANTVQKWLASYSVAASAPLGTSFQLAVTSAEAVDAEYLHPIRYEAQPEGMFAISSALFTVTAGPTGQTFASWQSSVFTPAQLADPNISGPTSDADGDGLITFLEYAFNLNPLLADRDTVPTGDRGVPHGTIVRAFDPVSQSDRDYLEIGFVRRKEPMDLIYTLEHSADMMTWSDALAVPAYLVLTGTQEVGLPGTLERVTYRTTQPVGSALPRFVRTRVQPKP